MDLDEIKENILKARKKKRISCIPQITNAIISITMGLTTLQLRRPHKYVDGGIYHYSYPFDTLENPIISDYQLSFFAMNSPALSAIIIAILNSIYLFKARINKEIKLWVKILIISLTAMVDFRDGTAQNTTSRNKTFPCTKCL